MPELTAPRLRAFSLSDNLASGRVMLKNKMVKEGELVQHTKRDGRYHDLWQYRLTRAEYAAQQNGAAPGV